METRCLALEPAFVSGSVLLLVPAPVLVWLLVFVLVPVLVLVLVLVARLLLVLVLAPVRSTGTTGTGTCTCDRAVPPGKQQERVGALFSPWGPRALEPPATRSFPAPAPLRPLRARA